MLRILRPSFRIKKFVPVLILLIATSVGAQQSAQQNLPDNNDKPETSPLIELGTEYQNGIKLLQNRFRIDHEVEEITMVFFREYGSTPVVLVRPDGSKIFSNQADGESIFWYDSTTYDMVSIKNPTPGPWQAVGQILPESRVMVISDLQLHADSLPKVIFSGEILKQTAYLTNAGEPIDYSDFRDVVTLDIELLSTNNPNFNNFGAHAEMIANFEDNGKGMDERPLDGVFTGQFNLAIADGEWIPVFRVSTPMFTREQIDENLILYPNPINISVELNGGGGGYHKLLIDGAREHVDMSTLLIDGKIRFPNGDVQNFSITDMSPDIREHLIVDYEYGVYRVKLTAYGNTVDGRDFILDVPEYSFLSEEPEVEIPIAPIDVQAEQQASMGDGGGITDDPMMAQDDEMPTSTLITIIVGINMCLLLVGGGLIWFVTRDKKIVIDENTVKPKVGLFSKLAALLPGKKKQIVESDKTTEKPTKNDDGIVDLSLPKD